MIENLPFAAILVMVVIFSLCVGSFLNVVIYRLPLTLRDQWRRDAIDLLDLQSSHIEITESMGLAFPSSHCPHCKHTLKPWHNIPLFSFIFLKGKCSFCESKIRIRYPLIETLTAVLTVLVVLRYGLTPAAGFGALLIWFLIVLSCIDLDTKLLPDTLTLSLLWLGLIANYFDLFTTLKSAVTGAIIGYLFLWLLYWIFKFLTKKEGMGYGDFKLLSAFGAWFGWQSIVFISFLSAVIGIIMFFIIIRIKSPEDQDYEQIPFGPGLAIAAIFYLFYGQIIINGYLKWLS